MIPTLVLTRPAPQSREIAAALGGSVPVIISPVMRIMAADACPDLTRYDGVVLTSANALGFVPALGGKPAWCVGKRTAAAASEAGADVRLVARDADDLVLRFNGVGPLIHLRGAHARGRVAERLNTAGIETDEAVVYRQQSLDLTPFAKAALSGDARVVLPLYSPRSARLVAAQIGTVGSALAAIAMSDAVARTWEEATGQAAEVAVTPTGDAMLAAIRKALRG
jgi:uroporphyrinogen-III synthase